MDLKSMIKDYLKRIVKNRALTLLILLIILLSLCFYYNDNFTKHQNYPTATDELINYTPGETFSFSNTIHKTYDGGFYIHEKYQGTLLTLKVNSSQEVDSGDKVEFLGTIEPDNQIISSKMIITKKWSYYSLLIRSFLALLILLLIFNQYWKFNQKTREFIRRK